MSIQPITWNSPEIADFIALPWKIYSDQHHWIPPLKVSVQAELSPQNLFFTHGEAQIFVAKDATGQVVGRIVASTDQTRLDQEKVGFWGYFETMPDLPVAGELLEAAENWLKSRGKTVVHGPVNLNIYTGYRLQTAGFDKKPFLGEPRSPAYYADFMQLYGYAAHAAWNSWDIPGPQLAAMTGYMAHKVQQTPNPEGQSYTIHTIDLNQFEAEMTALHPVAMDVFRDNYGFSAIEPAEFIHVYSSLKPVMELNPELFGTILDKDQNIVGFGLGYLDYAPAFQAINGDISQFSLLATAKPDTMVFHTFGIQEDHRKSNISYRIFSGGLHYSQERGCTHVIGALAKSGKTAYDQLGQPSRSYAVFQKQL